MGSDRLPSFRLEKGRKSRSRRDSLNVNECGSPQRKHSIFRPERLEKALTSNLANYLSEDYIPVSSNASDDLFSKFPKHQSLYFEERVCKFKQLKALNLGSYFGEIGLTLEVPRDVTAICASDVNVITLTKWAYERASEEEVLKPDSQDKWDFFSELLQEDSKDVLKKFCKAFQEEKRIYGQKILQQGDILKKMYVLYQGEVQVIRGFGDGLNK